MKDKSAGMGGKILTLLVFLLIVFYFGYQFFASLMPFTTGTAVYYEAHDGIQTTATVIRSESIVSTTEQGVKYFIVGDGEKVSKDGVIANIYNSVSDAQIYTDMSALEKQIKALKDVQAYNNTEAVDLDLLNNKIDDALMTVMNACEDGVYSDADEHTAELLKLLNRKKMAIGEESDFTAAIASLQAEYAAISATAPAAVATVKSDVSGYFVSMADGFENKLTADTAKTMTPEQLSSLEPEPVSESAVGKIVADYNWYIACPMSIKDSANFKVGDKVKIKTNLNTVGELSMTVEAINLGDGKDALLLFSCHNMNGDLATMRTVPVTVVTGEYSGLRVSNDALRIVDGKSGVYVISGMQAKFVEVEVVHRAKGYTLCKLDNTGADGTLQLYDEVIEKGRNLYDGKIVR